MLRRRTPLRSSIGTLWPPAVKAAIRARDRGCVGPRIGMPGECVGEVHPDHVRASGALSMKSRSTLDNGALLCAEHHDRKGREGRIWRPHLIAWIDMMAEPEHARCVDPCSPICPTLVAR